MASFQIQKNGKVVSATFKGAGINRSVRCPDKLAKKVKTVYYPDKMTVAKYNVPSLHVDGNERNCHELLMGRVWNTLWEDGWR